MASMTPRVSGLRRSDELARTCALGAIGKGWPYLAARHLRDGLRSVLVPADPSPTRQAPAARCLGCSAVPRGRAVERARAHFAPRSHESRATAALGMLVRVEPPHED